MPAPRFWQTATLHLDPPCPLPAINGGYCPWRCGELTAWLEVILPADAPAPARLTSRLGFLTSEWRRRHAAPPSRPTPSETVAEIVVGVSDLRPQFSSTTPGSLELRPQEQPAAAGMQARTPTCLLDPSLTMLIPPPRRPSVANSPALRDPRPPRAFPVPMRHAGVGTTLRTPLPVAQMGDLCSALGALCTAQTSTTGGLRRTSPATQSIIMSR